MSNAALMQPPTGPQPLHHVTVQMPMEDMEGWTARVLCLQHPDGRIEIFQPLLKFFRAHHTRSSSWQDKFAQGIGLLWDFGVQTKARRPDRNARDLLRDFALALVKGTIATDGSDPTHLYWPSTGYRRSKELVKAIEKFAAWCEVELNLESPISPEFVPLVPGSAEHLAAMIRWSRLRQGSMLQHISHAPTTKQRGVVEHGRDPAGRSAEAVKFFPPEHAARLLWEGYKIAGAEREQNIFLRYNVRNMMITLLDGWGGLRRSEGFHLWVQDVVEDPNNLQRALVVLNHPAESGVEFSEPITRRLAQMTRREFLKRQYGMLPRNEVTRGAYHAGFKGMDLDQRYQACVFWIDPDAGSLFWPLYWGYLNYVRTPIMEERIRLGGRDHPFLFVSARGDESEDGNSLPGEPYSEASYERAHAAAVGRIGLDCEKYLGTSTHGLRHLYGQTLEALGVPPQVIKKGLHHRNYLSQVPYTVPDNSRTAQQLRAAQEKIIKGEMRAIAPIASTTSEALLRIREFMAGGPFG